MLKINNLTAGYGGTAAFSSLSFEIETGKVTTIIGPNGCGKSTLLKSLSRIIAPMSGEIFLSGQNFKKLKPKHLAQKISLLSQHHQAPDDLTVQELVKFGRLPHKKWFESMNAEDEAKIQWAMEQTGVLELKDLSLGMLSGGQRQRAYIAQALCQDPEILLLDEPTTFLDITFQLEVMELVQRLNQELGLTVIMVLHDLNQAIKYSHQLLVMKKGKLIAHGNPYEVAQSQLIRQVYAIENVIEPDPLSRPHVFPLRSSLSLQGG
ncbi:MAG: ABC transporter ATP-binding protein [Turicibacter sp.]|nr:ABC transporter ATP-binding protein [Turicibacter sp.]